MKQLGAQHACARQLCPAGQSIGSLQPASTASTVRQLPSVSQYCASAHGGLHASTHTRSRQVLSGGQSTLVAHGTLMIFVPQLQPIPKTISPKSSARM
jgi:hypothetical protein